MKGQTQKEMKKMRWERNEQKQKVTKKGWKNVSKEKHKKSKEIHFKNTEEFFFREREIQSDKTNKTGVCSQKCFS